MAAPKVLIRTDKGAAGRARAVEPSAEAGWRVVVLAGLFLGAVGWLDAVLLWVPPRFGSAEWEFGTVSTMFNAMPLPTIGLALAVAGMLALGWTLGLRLAGWFAMAVILALLAALVLYGLDLPPALKAVPPGAKSELKRVIAKTVVLAIGYLVAYATLGVLILRRLRAAGTLRRGAQ